MSGFEIPGGRYVGDPNFIQSDGTPMVLAAIARYPKISVGCVFNAPQTRLPEYALSIRHMPKGCVALNARSMPHFTIQALCAHHEGRQTPLGDSLLLADLSLDGMWSRTVGVELPLPVGFDEACLAEFATTALGRAVYGLPAESY